MEITKNRIPSNVSKNLKLWINAGLICFADTGRIEINKICRKVRFTKPSFYYIYPNSVKSRGTDLFFIDIIRELDQRLDNLEKLMYDCLDSHSNTERVVGCLMAIEKYYVEYRCLAHLSIPSDNVKAQKVFQKHHDNLCVIKIRIFHDFYSNMPNRKALIICSCIIQRGYLIAMVSPDIKLWKDHVFYINKRLYLENNS
jgi:hypothetical protein